MGFNDPGLFDHVKAGRLELADLLQAMHLDTPLDTLLASSPFLWSRERTVSYIGEEIGNLLDPGAGKDSVQWQFLEDLEAAGDAALGGSYDETLKQGGASWAALMDE